MSALAPPAPAPDPLATPVPAHLLDPDPIEHRGGRRDDARLLVATGEREPVDARMRDLPAHLRPGDLLVVNLSATLPAALDTAEGLRVHVAGPAPDGPPDVLLVELREPDRAGSRPHGDASALPRLRLAGGTTLRLLAPYALRADGGVRLWRARAELPGGLHAYLVAHGQPVRYGGGARRWPLADYQTVFASMPGSAEMPSAGRGFTLELIGALHAGGVELAPIVLHTGPSSPEAGEPPLPERYWVPEATARRVNRARARGGRVVAVGTTAVRALETDAHAGRARPARGWTETILGAERGVQVVDGLLTGWHEPGASHRDLLAAVASPGQLARSYAAALGLEHRWHELGDFNLLMPEARARGPSKNAPIGRMASEKRAIHRARPSTMPGAWRLPGAAKGDALQPPGARSAF